MPGAYDVRVCDGNGNCVCDSNSNSNGDCCRNRRRCRYSKAQHARCGMLRAWECIMSLKYTVQQQSECHYVLPRVGGMRGIIGNTSNTPLDECGHVYKDLDQVLSVLAREGIAELRHRLYPVANIKGTD